MAMIQKIRDNSALTFIVVGGALLAFVLTDSLSSGSSDDISNTVGSYEGKDISVEQYDTHRRLLSLLQTPTKDFGSYTDQELDRTSTQTWQMMLNDEFVNEEAKQLGITVTESELEEMMTGERADGFFVNYLFGGQQNFIQNRQKIKDDYLNYTEYAAMAYRDPQTNQSSSFRLPANSAVAIKQFGVKLKIQNKYNNLLSNCFFTTSSLAQDQYVLNQEKKDFKIAYVQYRTVNDSTINPSEAEIKAAYEELKPTFKKKEKETRKLVYASLPIQPSGEDRNVVAKELADIKIELLSPEFVNNKAAAINIFKYESDMPFYNGYFKKGEYPIKSGGIDTSVFNLKKGEAIGPLYANAGNQFVVAQVMDEKLMADSAEVSGIIISDKPWSEKYFAGGQQPDEQTINKLKIAYKKGCDSILDLVKNNPNALASIPLKYWADSLDFAKKGKLGWVQENSPKYGKNFTDSIFLSKEGEAKLTYTQQGFLAVVKPDQFGKKVRKLQIGAVVKNVTPLDKTLDDFMSKANSIAFALKEGKGFTEFRDSFYYFIDSTQIQGSTFALRGITGARELVYWGLKAELNVPSQVFTTTEKYIVAMVTEINESEYKSLEETRFECEAYARKKKQKAAILDKLPTITTENIANFPDLIAAGLVSNSTDVAASKLNGELAQEGKLVGTLAGLQAGKISKVIEGENGIYVVYVEKVNEAKITEDTNLSTEKSAIEDASKNLSYSLVQEYLNDKLDVVDNRRIIQ